MVKLIRIFLFNLIIINKINWLINYAKLAAVALIANTTFASLIYRKVAFSSFATLSFEDKIYYFIS